MPSPSTTQENEMSVSRTFEVITENERALAVELGVDLQASMDERLDRAVTKTNTALRLVVEAGLDLLSIKSECEHGKFGELMQERGISRQRASEMMKMARFSAQLSSAERKKLMNLPKRKALALASTDPEIVHKVLENEEAFNDISNLNYQSMRERIRELEQRNADLEVDLDTAETQKEELKSRLKKERSGSPYPDFFEVTRNESDALTQKCLLALDDLHRLSDDLIKLNEDPHLSEEFRSYLNMSATTLMVHLNAIAAKTSQAVHNIEFKLPPVSTSKGVDANLIYSDDEINHAINEREMLVREHEQEKQIRANQREANKPRGRGRPKKTETA